MKPGLSKQFLILLLLLTGCIKEIYDIDMLSDEMHLTPSIFVPVFKGSATFSDLVRENDTIVYDENNFVKIMLRQDSIFELGLTDFYNLEDMAAFSKSFRLGNLKIDPFQSSLCISLGQLIQGLPVDLKNQITSLDDNEPHQFPELPSFSVTEMPFTDFSNIREARFSSGFVDITITNNLNTPLSSFQITLFNAVGQIGSPLEVPGIAPGESLTVSMDLEGIKLTQTLRASVSFSGSPGNSQYVDIDLSENKVLFNISGRDLSITSGTVILPQQTISTGPVTDTIIFSPEQAIEIERMALIGGSIWWNMSTTLPLDLSAGLLFPEIKRDGNPLNETIYANSKGQGTGKIYLNNTIVNLDSDIKNPYNRLAFEHRFNVSSKNIFVSISNTDEFQFELSLSSPAIDYIKGYFGQETQSFNHETRDLEIREMLNKFSGDFQITDPKVRLSYSNSFALPIEVVFDIQGLKGNDAVILDLDPISIKYPESPKRDISETYLIDRNNSELPDFVSLPPEKIAVSGSAKMNPLGDPDKLRDNYMYGSSRFIGSLEVEIPLELRLNNLHFCDTTDNFIGKDLGFDTDNASLITFDINAENGFPFGLSLSVSFYDSDSKNSLRTVVLDNFLEAAPVDTDGKVNGVANSSKRIEFSKEFMHDLGNADKVIFDFGVNTYSPGAVKIYSDYKVDFNVVLGVKMNLDF